MIGFSQDLQESNIESQEGLETANRGKYELYDMIANTYMVPPFGSRGVTREYLLQVWKNEVFRVESITYKHFEVNLTKKQLKKVGITNNSMLVKKLNILLKETGRLELGFTEYDAPEQTWLFKVARFIDRSNLLEFFEETVIREPPLSPQSMAISQIHLGRQYAGEWLFRLEKARRNKKLWEAFKNISDTYRSLASFRINADVLKHELKHTNERISSLEMTLHDQVCKSAFYYTSYENPKVTPELAIAGGEEFTPEMRTQLSTNAKL